MNKLEELEAAWNAKADQFNQWGELGLDEIVAFAQEVEREECAKTCEKHILKTATTEGARKQAQGNATAIDCANAIRMRSNNG